MAVIHPVHQLLTTSIPSQRTFSPYKTVSDVDSAIARLQAQVESGSMKIVDEKRALAEMTNLRKSRRGIEGFEAQQKVRLRGQGCAERD